MKFTENSLKYLGSYIDEINNKLDSANAKKNKLMDKQTDASEKKSARLQRRIDKIDAQIGEYFKIAREIQTLSSSNQEYNIVEVDSIPYTDDDSVIGGAMYNFDTNQFDVMLKSSYATTYNIAHELKHAYQFEIGEFATSNVTGYIYDITDEYAAYQRGTLLGGPKKSEFEINSEYKKIYDARGKYPCSSGIIPANATILQFSRMNARIAFRYNGKTYMTK